MLSGFEFCKNYFISSRLISWLKVILRRREDKNLNFFFEVFFFFQLKKIFLFFKIIIGGKRKICLYVFSLSLYLSTPPPPILAQFSKENVIGNSHDSKSKKLFEKICSGTEGLYFSKMSLSGNQVENFFLTNPINLSSSLTRLLYFIY